MAICCCAEHEGNTRCVQCPTHGHVSERVIAVLGSLEISVREHNRVSSEIRRILGCAPDVHRETASVGDVE
jgi:hypothetical protein